MTVEDLLQLLEVISLLHPVHDARACEILWAMVDRADREAVGERKETNERDMQSRN
jgi:hypothetical protein